jgi:MATE family multidrug resistance protein
MLLNFCFFCRWAFEVLTLMASVLGPDAVDAQTIILQISILTFMFPYGVGVASASIVGNALGAGDVSLARSSGNLALLLIFVLDFILAVGLVTLGPFYIAILTTNPEVIKTTTSLLPFLAVFLLLDGLQGVASGILRGAGKQKLGAVLGFITYYAIGLPMAWFLTFKCHIGVAGLIIGISTGTVFQTSILMSLLLFFSYRVYTLPASMLTNLDKLKDEKENEHEHGKKKCNAV